MSLVADRRVRVSREYVDADYGHWCNDCRLPSGIRVWIAVTVAGRMQLQTHLVCDQDGYKGHDITIDEEAARRARH